jgi:hypothetical protein
MAYVTLKGSRIMTGLDAVPPVLADPGEGGGRVKVWVETVETNADDSVSSTYLLARLPSNARILGASKVYWDDLGTLTTTLDIGVYNLSGRADITDDPDALNDGLAVSTSASNASLVKDISNYGLPLWDYATGTTDPKCMLEIRAVLADAAVNAAGTITVEIFYTTD